jgi:hypothetical protein
MQPYFFPYLGYFQLINLVDKWIVFDETQFISKGWVNRNRILHPNEDKEWQYFTLPLRKKKREAMISEVEINMDLNWQAQLLGKLTAYKRKAPYYQQVIDFLLDAVDFADSNLSRFTIHTLKKKNL